MLRIKKIEKRNETKRNGNEKIGDLPTPRKVQIKVYTRTECHRDDRDLDCIGEGESRRCVSDLICVE
jgi:hypothetical protein